MEQLVLNLLYVCRSVVSLAGGGDWNGGCLNQLLLRIRDPAAPPSPSRVRTVKTSATTPAVAWERPPAPGCYLYRVGCFKAPTRRVDRRVYTQKYHPDYKWTTKPTLVDEILHTNGTTLTNLTPSTSYYCKVTAEVNRTNSWSEFSNTTYIKTARASSEDTPVPATAPSSCCRVPGVPPVAPYNVSVSADPSVPTVRLAWGQDTCSAAEEKYGPKMYGHTDMFKVQVKPAEGQGGLDGRTTFRFRLPANARSFHMHVSVTPVSRQDVL